MGTRPKDGPLTFNGGNMSKRKRLGIITAMTLAIFFALAVMGADKKLSDYPALNQSDWASGDKIPIIDVSAGANKNTTVLDFDTRYFKNGSILGSAYGGTGLDGSAASNGKLLIGNGSGYSLANITGTANQVIVTNGSGTIGLSLPQSIGTGSSPTFAGATIGSSTGPLRVTSGVLGTGSMNLATEITGLLPKANGGTGADNSSVTFPASGVIVTEAGSQTLTNKTLTSPVISTISNTGSLTLPTSTDTLVGRATTDTLTNKTLTAPVISTISNSGTITLPTGTKTLATLTGTEALTNKDIDGGTASNSNRITLPKDTKSNLDSLTRKTGTLVYASDELKAYVDNGSALVAVGSGSGGGVKNFVTNPNCETNTTGVTSSSTPANISGQTGNPLITGNLKNCRWNPGTTNATLKFDIDALDPVTIAGDCSAIIYTRATTFGEYSAYIEYDSVAVSSEIALNASVDGNAFQIDRPCTSGVTTRKLVVKALSGATTPLEVAVKFQANQDKGSIPLTTPMTAYTMVIGGSTSAPTKASSPLADAAFYSLRGDVLVIDYDYMQSATTGAANGSGDYLFPIPTGYTIDTAKLGATYNFNTQKKGWAAVRIGSNEYQANIRIENSTTLKLLYQDAATSTAFVSSSNAGLGSNATVRITFHAEVPIVGNNTGTISKANKRPAYYYGTHASNCAWTLVGNSTLGAADYGGDSTCTFATKEAQDISCVSQTSGGNNSPGVTCTFTEPGKYEACAKIIPYGSVATGHTHRLYDGTNSLDESSEISNGEPSEIKLCGPLTVSSLTASLRIQSDAGSGNNILQSQRSPAPAIVWSIQPIGRNATAANYVGSATFDSDESKRLFSFSLAVARCTSSPCSIAESSFRSGSGFSVTRASTGTYDINVPSGYCARRFTCGINVQNWGGSAGVSWYVNGTPSATQMELQFIQSTAVHDVSFEGFCTCPRP